MELDEPTQALQATLISSYSFVVIQFEGLRKVDIEEVKQIYGILNSALHDLFGFIGSSKIPFDIVAHKEDIAIIRVPAKKDNEFISATSLIGSSNGVPCHIVFHGSYPTMLSAVRKTELLAQSALLSF